MTDILQALNAPHPAISELIEEYGASRKDLIDIGWTDYTARKWLRELSPRLLSATEAVQVPSLGIADEVVALVPMGELGRSYLDYGVYIRDAQLRGQIRLRATHLGWSDAGKIEIIRPINQRWRIGSAAGIASTTANNVAALLAQPNLHKNWPGPATLIELGEPITIGLALGFAPNPTGGAPAIPGMRHVLRADLRAAARSGGTLLEVETL